MWKVKILKLIRINRSIITDVIIIWILPYKNNLKEKESIIRLEGLTKTNWYHQIELLRLS